MTTQARNFTIPSFLALNTNVTPDRVVAAVRYDLEIKQLSLGVVIDRYDTLLGEKTIRDIVSKKIKPDVKPAKLRQRW